MKDFLRRVTHHRDWWLRGYRWYRCFQGGVWVQGSYLHEFTSWCPVGEWDDCPIRQRYEIRRESWAS